METAATISHESKQRRTVFGKLLLTREGQHLLPLREILAHLRNMRFYRGKNPLQLKEEGDADVLNERDLRVAHV